MAFKLSDEFMMSVGTVVLALFIAFDLYKAYTRGAKWLPGNFLLLCGLSVQLLGYLDIQHLSFASRHKDHDVEAVIAKQLSIDLSRLVLFVFVGYLLPGLASAKRLWSNIAALTISLSSHIAMELLAFQTYVTENGKAVQGHSGIWLIAYYYVLLTSILGLLFLFIWAVGNGRFIRDNLSSRIHSILSGSIENEASSLSWEAYKSEILKSWIVARVCQPEYVLGRTRFSAGVGIVLTNCVGVFSAKVICIRSQLHGPLPLLTLQFVFIILVWFAVMYRWYSAVIYFRDSPNLFNFRFNVLYIFIFNILLHLFEWLFESTPSLRLYRILSLSVYLILCLVPFLIFLGFCGSFYLYFYICSFSWWLSGLILGLCRVQTKSSSEKEFDELYKPTLKRLCWPREHPYSLWVANESSFKDIQDKVREAYCEGEMCEELITVIRNKPGGDYYVRRVEELLEPLESVKEYFPLLKNSFRRITAQSLLFIMLVVCDNKFNRNTVEAYEQALELMDFIDCPDDIGINVDVLRTKNVEAFELKSASGGYQNIGFVARHKKRKFWDLLRKSKVKEMITIEDALSYIRNLQQGAETELQGCKLLEKELNAEVLITEWSVAKYYYGLYKACKTILDWSVEPDGHFLDTVHLADELSKLFAELMARYVEESLVILLNSTKRWAKKFNEDKITAAIHIAGFAWGVKDAAQPKLQTQSDEASSSTAVADTAVVIPETDNL